jgi:hypothetical protein
MRLTRENLPAVWNGDEIADRSALGWAGLVIEAIDPNERADRAAAVQLPVAPRQRLI